MAKRSTKQIEAYKAELKREQRRQAQARYQAKINEEQERARQILGAWEEFQERYTNLREENARLEQELEAARQHVEIKEVEVEVIRTVEVPREPTEQEIRFHARVKWQENVVAFYREIAKDRPYVMEELNKQVMFLFPRKKWKMWVEMYSPADPDDLNKVNTLLTSYSRF